MIYKQNPIIFLLDLTNTLILILLIEITTLWRQNKFSV